MIKLLCVGMAIALCAAAPALGAGNVLVDVPSMGTPLPADSVSDSDIDGTQTVSADGRYVVFESASDGLVAGDNDGSPNIYRKDLQTGAVVLVSTGPAAPTTGAGTNDTPAINGDGSVIAFRSSLALVPEDTNASYDIYKRTITGPDGSGTTTLVSCPITGPCHGDPGFVQGAAVSADGATIAWTTDSGLSAGDTDGALDAYARAAGITFPVSVGSDGAFAPGFVSSELSIDGDGSRIVFSASDVLKAEGDPTDTNGSSDVYGRDVTTAKTRLISRTVVAPGGTPAAAGGTAPDIGDGGGRVVYKTAAALIAGDTNGTTPDVYAAGFAAAVDAAPTLVSAVPGAQTSQAAGGESPSISGDGSLVGFLSTGSFVGGVPAGPSKRGYIRTVSSGAVALVTRADGAGVEPRAELFGAPLGLDLTGAHAAFETDVPASPDGPAGSRAVYLRDLGAAGTRLVSRPPGDAPVVAGADDASLSPGAAVTSDDERYVVFGSAARGLTAPGGPPGVYRRDLRTGTTIRVDVTSGGAAPDGPGSLPSISADGTKVAFLSSADDLVAGDTNGAGDVFVRDLTSGTTARVDLDSGGAQLPHGGSVIADISADGARVLFATSDPIDTAADSGQNYDLYVSSPGGPALASRATGAGAAATQTGAVYGNGIGLSRDGHRVLFLTTSAALGDGDTNPAIDAHVRDIDAGTTRWASRRAAGASNGTTSDAHLSADGTHVIFLTTASDLGDGDTDTTEDVHVRDMSTDGLTWVSRLPGLTGGPLTYTGVLLFAISPDGARAALDTNAALSGADTNDAFEPYVRDLATGDVTRAVSRADGGQVTGSVFTPVFSASGACLLDVSTAPGLVDGGYASTDFSHLYLTPLGAGCKAPLTPETATPSPTPTPPPSASPSPSPSPSPTPTPAPPDTTKPRLTSLKLAAKTIRVGRARTKAGRKAPLGTRLKGKLSEDATLTLRVQKESAGRKVGSKCRKPTHANRKKKRCTLRTTRKTIRATAKQGSLSITVKPSGVEPGTYRLAIAAKDAAGNVSEETALKLKIVR